MRTDARMRKHDVKPRRKVKNPLDDLASVKLSCDLFFLRRGMNPKWDTDWDPPTTSTATNKKRPPTSAHAEGRHY